MYAVETTLRRFRGWFLAWFVLEAAAGTAVAAYVQTNAAIREAFLCPATLHAR